MGPRVEALNFDLLFAFTATWKRLSDLRCSPFMTLNIYNNNNHNNDNSESFCSNFSSYEWKNIPSSDIETPPNETLG